MGGSCCSRPADVLYPGSPRELSPVDRALVKSITKENQPPPIASSAIAVALTASSSDGHDGGARKVESPRKRSSATLSVDDSVGSIGGEDLSSSAAMTVGESTQGKARPVVIHVVPEEDDKDHVVDLNVPSERELSAAGGANNSNLLSAVRTGGGHNRYSSMDSVDLREFDENGNLKRTESIDVDDAKTPSPLPPTFDDPVDSGDDELNSLMVSAAAGDAFSQYCLGYGYDSGELVGAVDTQKAIEWYTKAAASGHGEAMNNLGVLYITGHGGRVPVDAENGLKWFLEGAKIGNKECQFHTALCYLQNATSLEAEAELLSETGVTTWWEQLQEALKNFKAASDQGHVPALVNTAVLILDMHRNADKRRSVRPTSPSRKNKSQLKDTIGYSEMEGIQLMKHAADDLEDPIALHNLGVMYKFGLFGLEKSGELYKSHVQKAMTGKNKGIISKRLSRMKRDDGTLMSYSFS
eukprot:TRINITY_DN77092_c0_g1_i1.p1 TRINITY_DN77092_c0_g1~~TRINITY_DN77092_c0_g1_i1.p1  ORF type:complete len:468 (-),score=128.99 TRINITY_DN77092_c0_g1_i1:51-1454(-)